MTRAERIEEAARALLDALSERSIWADDAGGIVYALRAALALPVEPVASAAPAPAADKLARRWCRCHHIDFVHDADGRCMGCPCERFDNDDDPKSAAPAPLGGFLKLGEFGASAAPACKHRWFRKDDYDLCVDCGAKESSAAPASGGCERCGGSGEVTADVDWVYEPCPACGTGKASGGAR